MPRTQKQYVKYAAAFERWMARRRRPSGLDFLDRNLADFLGTLLCDGAPSSGGDKVVAAVLSKIPAVSRNSLIQTLHTLKGSQKACPGKVDQVFPTR